MKILIISIVDIKKSRPTRLHHFIEYLSQKHNLTILCINDQQRAKNAEIESLSKDFQDIISKIGVRYFTERNISPIFQELFAPILIKGLENENFDLIFNYNTLVSGGYVAKKLDIPMVYDLADDLPAMIAESPDIPSNFREAGKWFGNKMVKRTVLCSKAVCTISDIYQEKFSIPDEKFHVISNGVDTSHFKKVESSIRRDLNLESDFTLGYVGALREWVDLTPVYEVLNKLDSTKLVIVGQEGLFRENLELAKKYAVQDKVFFIGHVQYSRLPEYIAAMDVCLIPFKNNDTSHNSIPLKLFEYMACEKPVISSRLTGVQQTVKNKIFYADTAEEYESLLIGFKNSYLNLSQLLESNRIFVEEFFTWNQASETLEKLLKSLL
jgi:glycosyltransferase involved in cell wall biosynthesis